MAVYISFSLLYCYFHILFCIVTLYLTFCYMFNSFFLQFLTLLLYVSVYIYLINAFSALTVVWTSKRASDVSNTAPAILVGFTGDLWQTMAKLGNKPGKLLFKRCLINMLYMYLYQLMWCPVVCLLYSLFVYCLCRIRSRRSLQVAYEISWFSTGHETSTWWADLSVTFHHGVTEVMTKGLDPCSL